MKNDVEENRQNARRSQNKLIPTWEWQARWTSYWYGDREFFDFSAQDFDRRALELQQAGINAAITFGGFHFRWSFIDEWPRLLQTLRHICQSCHRYGIKVVEHHSAVLTWNPIAEDEWRAVAHFFDELGFPVDIRRHPGFMRQMEIGDARYQGHWLSDMRQIDPRTGQFSRTAYRGWSLCYNNPAWQRLYFAHLRDVYACGVDGIMTDDIQFWPANYGCGCQHCRTQFQTDTGYKMPVSGDPAPDFYNNSENAAWRRWVLWRIECHRLHQLRVFKHARRYGMDVMRPIYSSSNTNAFAPRGMGMALDNLHGLYSTIFAEVNQTDLQAHCWLRIGAESAHRRALAARNQVPSMCLFYPNNADENMFCWAMTKSWGQHYWGTNWRLGAKVEAEMLMPIFQFEKKYSDYYERIESVAEVGVLFSARSVWLHQDADQPPDYVRMSDPATTDCWAGWCELLALANIPYDTLLEDDLAERRYFERLRLIIVPNAVCLDERQIRALKAFVRAGGSAIVAHQTGLKNAGGVIYQEHPLAGLIGADYGGLIPHSSAWLPTGDMPTKVRACHNVKAPASLFKCRAAVEKWMDLADGAGPAVFAHRYGKGRVVTFAGKPGRLVCINRHAQFKCRGRRYARVDFHQDPAIMALMEKSVRHLLGDTPMLTVTGAPRGCLVSVFARGRRRMLHVVNAAGTLADSGEVVSLPVPLKFPRLDRLPSGDPLIRIKVRHTGVRAGMVSPEFSGCRQLVCTRHGDYAVIELPSRLIRCYGLVVLE